MLCGDRNLEGRKPLLSLVCDLLGIHTIRHCPGTSGTLVCACLPHVSKGGDKDSRSQRVGGVPSLLRSMGNKGDYG